MDRRGLTVDFLLSEHRDIPSAKRFFTGAVKQHGAPEKITPDGYPATHSAVAELRANGSLHPLARLRTSKYLNNLAEQGHGRVKQRIYPMLGFKNFSNAAVTISGIELVQKIKKGHFEIAKFMNDANVRVPEGWEAVLVG